MRTTVAASERELRRLERLADFIRVAAATHRLTGMRGQANVMLVGPPGYGKTQMLLRLQGNAGTLVLSDTTFLGAIKMLDKARFGYLSTVICPDFGPSLARDLPQTRKVIAVFSMAIEEGVQNMVVGKMERNFNGARFGLLTALTTDDIATHYQVLNGSGFLSRFVLLELSMTEEALIAAVTRLRSGDHRLTGPLHLPDARQAKIAIPPQYMKAADGLWRHLLKERDDRASGFRGLHLYQSLLAAICYLRQGRTRTVTSDDVDLLQSYHDEFLLTQLKMAV